MSAPKWEDVEVGDAIIAEWGPADTTITGTVGYTSSPYECIELAGGYMVDIAPRGGWTLLDIVKPGPQLPTSTGSLVRVRDSNHFYMRADDDGWYCSCGLHDVDAPTDWELVYDAGKK